MTTATQIPAEVTLGLEDEPQLVQATIWFASWLGESPEEKLADLDSYDVEIWRRRIRRAEGDAQDLARPCDGGSAPYVAGNLVVRYWLLALSQEQAEQELIRLHALGGRLLKLAEEIDDLRWSSIADFNIPLLGSRSGLRQDLAVIRLALEVVRSDDPPEPEGIGHLASSSSQA